MSVLNSFVLTTEFWKKVFRMFGFCADCWVLKTVFRIFEFCADHQVLKTVLSFVLTADHRPLITVSSHPRHPRFSTPHWEENSFIRPSDRLDQIWQIWPNLTNSTNVKRDNVCVFWISYIRKFEAHFSPTTTVLLVAMTNMKRKMYV